MGGSGFDYVIGLDIDDSGNAYLAGFTGSAAFPTTIDGNDRVMTGSNDGFFAVLNAAGTGLTYSTFIGGTGQDRAKDVVWNAATGSAYVGGQNEFPDGPTLRLRRVSDQGRRPGRLRHAFFLQSCSSQ